MHTALHLLRETFIALARQTPLHMLVMLAPMVLFLIPLAIHLVKCKDKRDIVPFVGMTLTVVYLASDPAADNRMGTQWLFAITGGAVIGLVICASAYINKSELHASKKWSWLPIAVVSFEVCCAMAHVMYLSTFSAFSAGDDGYTLTGIFDVLGVLFLIWGVVKTIRTEKTRRFYDRPLPSRAQLADAGFDPDQRQRNTDAFYTIVNGS